MTDACHCEALAVAISMTEKIKREGLPRKRADCFAAFAMTERRIAAQKSRLLHCVRNDEVSNDRERGCRAKEQIASLRSQ
ncbi:MAG: hypothetical protein PHQ93_10480 [Sulfurimonas sp.]|uniref:hypothetical protein n=1 Tax=Sulfurimonas sp. TaxID=2022749 RepID=UPI0026107ED2|nr:hypothetical protein [Sulfurimonas sp.]MDD5401603.1 hypothetical protein [Sulfurimonas sp.]